MTFNRIGNEVSFTLPPAGSSSLRYLVVEVNATSTVILSSFDDVDIPAGEPAWPNEITADASRYGFEVMESLVVGNVLPLPLPTSVSVTSAYVIVVG